MEVKQQKKESIMVEIFDPMLIKQMRIMASEANISINELVEEGISLILETGFEPMGN